MTSVLKRKRGPVEVLDTPQRSKSLKSKNGKPLPPPTKTAIQTATGWDAAFKLPTELVRTNGVNGDGKDTNGRLGSPESINYEDVVKDREKYELEEEAPEESNQEVFDEPETTGTDFLSNSWKLSHSIGGRMVNADPVFTPDEKFLIVAKRATIEVYATANSLLTRSIALNLEFDAKARIITLCLSPTNPNILWVACSDGTVFSLDWTTGAGSESKWAISSTGCIRMTVASMESGGRRRDVVFTTEGRKTGGFRITASELHSPEDPIKTAQRTVYTSVDRIQFLNSVNGGTVLVGAAGAKVLIGRLRSNDFGTIDKIKYEFRSFESKDIISSLDVRISKRPQSKETKKAILSKIPIVDLVLGDVRGSIFVHSDLAGKLFTLKDGTPAGTSLIPQKLHWHHRAVETVKWSLDGNYVISGGSECVLVLWQLDTGKQQFLPYLAAAIQSVVVSPSGTSYAVKLADNSAMVISTADLEPKTHIAGIQAPAIQLEECLDAGIRRIEDAAWPKALVQRTPAVISPNAPSRLLLAVGQSQEFTLSKQLMMSNPFLQTFDLATSHSVSTQALTRTNTTNINVAPTAHRLTEPRVIHMKLSHDGQWLATVDEWIPTARDLEHLDFNGKEAGIELQHRREVHLKFWQWNTQANTWELVSRINTPHDLDGMSWGAGKVLDLAADPSSLQFATIGGDGVVRTWRPKSRKRDGVLVKGKDNTVLKHWHCLHEIPLGKPELQDDENNWSKPAATGCVAFSEDGSVLAAACSSQEGLLHHIDPQSGTIRLSQTDVVEGEIFGLEFLGPEIIIVSDRLIVFDIVSDSLKLDLQLQKSTLELSIDQKREMIHLAVDTSSRTFALALPKSRRGHVGGDLRHFNSELVVFHQDDQELQVKEVLWDLITALIPAVGSEGYLVLDAAAEIHTIMKKGSQAITSLAQSTSALQLDNIPDEKPAEQLIDLADTIEEDEEEASPHLPTPDATQDGNEDDEDDEHPVVTQQQLAEVFDIGPAFALPPMEEIFYQVAGLFASRPRPQRGWGA